MGSSHCSFCDVFQRQGEIINLAIVIQQLGPS